MRNRDRNGFLSIVIGLFCFFGAQPVFGATAQAATLSVIGFDYSDTSGEARDQTEEHAGRVKAFRVWLRDKIAERDGLRIVELPCLSASACTRGSTAPEALLAEAREAGADYLVFGGIQKMSTLVGWGRIDVLDVKTNRIVFDRVLTFRGDTDNAFERAARFAAKDIVKTLANQEDGQAQSGRVAR